MACWLGWIPHDLQWGFEAWTQWLEWHARHMCVHAQTPKGGNDREGRGVWPWPTVVLSHFLSLSSMCTLWHIIIKTFHWDFLSLDCSYSIVLSLFWYIAFCINGGKFQTIFTLQKWAQKYVPNYLVIRMRIGVPLRSHFSPDGIFQFWNWYQLLWELDGLAVL